MNENEIRLQIIDHGDWMAICECGAIASFVVMRVFRDGVRVNEVIRYECDKYPEKNRKIP